MINRTAKKFKEGLRRKERPKKKPPKESRKDRVDRKLRALGFADYDAYILSAAWRDYRARYARAYGPTIACVACGWAPFEMHHLSYDRVGRESLRDCIPLCHDHHEMVHDHHRRTRLPLGEFRRALRDLFGWSAAEVARRLARYDRLPA